jgi:outer membrane protein OmpA-like peptidoglycan-associated protein
MRFLFLIPGLMLLASCANVQQLKEMPAPEDDFASALMAEYISYAESEQEQGRWANAGYFAGKARDVSRGEDVLPDEPSANVDSPEKEELIAAHKSLNLLRNEKVKARNPQLLARVQLLFDCWNQQAKSGTSRSEGLRASCAENFAPELLELENDVQQYIYSAVKSYSLEFSTNSSRLTSAHQSTLRSVVKSIASVPDFVVVISVGSGRTASQKALAEKRLLATREALAAAGVPERRIRQYSGDDSKRVFLSGDKPRSNYNKVSVIIKTPKTAGES